MTTLTPYSPAAAEGSDGFAQLLHAEWTKFRTVRGWVAGILVAGLLTVGITLLNHSQCGFQPNPSSAVLPCPGVPTGPGGEAVTDSFYFVHQPLPGNGTITVRVTSLTGLYNSSSSGGMSATAPLTGYVPGVRPWAKTGIMIKASTAAGSAYAAMLVTGDNGVRMQYDYTGDIAGLPGAATAAAPRWLRLVRSGDTVTGYDSLDGAHWTRVGSVTLSGLPSTAQAGLFTASPAYVVYHGSLGSGGEQGGPTLATGTLDDLTTSWGSGTWAGRTVTGGAQAGSQGGPFNGQYKQANGTFTVSGSGDIAPNVISGPDGAGEDPTRAMVSGTFFALLAMVIVGAMFITAEYRRRMIRTTFSASPRRGRVLAAKAVVLAGVTFTVGLVGTAIALPLGEAVLRDGGNWIPPLPALTTARIIVGTAAAMAVAAVLALAVGAIARRGVAAVSAVIVVIVLPYLFAILPGLLPTSAENWMLRVFPAAAFAVQQAFPAYHQVLAQYGPDNGYYPLTWWAGFLVLCAWTAAALAVAAVLLKRRDA
ncbi:MAG TPA: ABC transporter permease subunit [Trebonia sp.]|jgi:ABC-type transport system involved in multi-copper enzyme maturation permease subunit